MVPITTLVAPSGECYEVKAGMVSLQCNNCVIHTWALHRRTSHNGFVSEMTYYVSSGTLNSTNSILTMGTIQIQLPLSFLARIQVVSITCIHLYRLSPFTCILYRRQNWRHGYKTQADLHESYRYRRSRAAGVSRPLGARPSGAPGRPAQRRRCIHWWLCYCYIMHWRNRILYLSCT